MIDALLDFVRARQGGGTLYAALYELGDDELITALEGAGKKLHLVLSNPDARATQQSASAISDGNADVAGAPGQDGRRADQPHAAQQPDRPQQVRRLRRHERQARGGALRLDQLDLDGPVRADQQHHRLRRRQARASATSTTGSSSRQDTAAAPATIRRRCKAPTLRTWDAASKSFALGDGAHADELVLAQHAEAAHELDQEREAPARHGRGRRS